MIVKPPLKRKVEGSGIEGSIIINHETRIITMHEIIDNNISSLFEDNLPILEEGKGEITIKINSFGGALPSVLSIISGLTSVDNLVITDVTGVAYSGAGMILLAGDYRRMSKLSLLMLHSPSWISHDTMEGHGEEVKRTNEHYGRVMKSLLKETKISYKEFMEKTKNKDWYISPQVAKKYGFVHEVY